MRRAVSLLSKNGRGSSGSSNRHFLHGAALGIVSLASATLVSLASSDGSSSSSSSSWFGFGSAPAVPASRPLLPPTPSPEPTASSASAVSLAEGHSCVRLLQGSPAVFAWGSNQFGQLGPACSSESEAVPIHIRDLDALNPIDLIAAADSVFALSASGDLYSWGRGDNFVLGQGSRTEVSRYPLRVPGLPPVRSAALSSTHAAAIDADGNVWTWGARALGRPYHEATAGAPAPVACPDWAGKKAVRAACGLNHTVIVLDSGEVYAFGSNAEGALGLGDDGNMSQSQQASWARWQPTGVTGGTAPSGIPQSNAAAAAAAAAPGRAGVKLNGTFERPARMGGIDGVKMVDAAAGKRFTLLLSEDGRVFSCGEDSYGQAGHGSTSLSRRYIYTPTVVQGLLGKKIVSIAAGDNHAAAVAEDGTVYTWGMGSDGQMGVRTRAFKNPQPLPNDELRDVRKAAAVDVACGGGHTAVLDADASLWMFGRGRDGQLGRGDKLESVAAGRDRPMHLDFVTGRYVQPKGGVVKVQLGTNCSYALALK